MLPIVRKTIVYVNCCLMSTKHSEYEQSGIVWYVSYDGKPYCRVNRQVNSCLMSHKRSKLLLLLLSSVRFTTDYTSRPQGC